MTEMPPQVWIHAGTPRPDLVRPPANRARLTLAKPDGGLWTSSVDARLGCDWIRFHRDGYDPDRQLFVGWLLVPAPEARIATVDGHADLRALFARYPRRDSDRLYPLDGLDWERLAGDYDALHLTARGQRDTHLPFTSPLTLYAWDCESTWWARWAFAGEPVAWRWERPRAKRARRSA